ncbi:placenta-specific protein 9 isoform X2 [Fukomys damarensis]|uniref:placenta-specific protein 9 isoform X2 n=1 Tax=Fukomys damarensis TaxID=885580 RepID=UPI00053F3F7B|nr:placenta-specific protein 9 isoform X2 [Fukomys damarensis]
MCLPAIVKAVLPCAHCTVRPNTAVPCSVRAQDIRRRKSSSDSEGTAAEPLSTSQGDPAWSTGCDRLEAVQGRLDVMEETVEKTVEHLETQVKSLLGLLEDLAWNLPPGPFSPAPDLLGDDHF